jgi:hypothetical protein
MPDFGSAPRSDALAHPLWIAALSGANVKAHLQMLVLRPVGQDLTSEVITCTFQLVLDPYPLPGLSRPQRRRPNMRDPAC